MSDVHDAEIDAARQLCYHFFATVLSDPAGRGWVRLGEPDHRTLVASAAGLLQEAAGALKGGLAPGERPAARFSLEPALESVGHAPEPIAAEYRRVFGFLLAKDCPP